MVPFPQTSELATVETGDQAVVFPLTQNDVLWTARAAARESANDAPITVWVFTQRAVLFKLSNSTATYTGILRSFSQPINPIWSRTGSMCRPGGKYATTDYCSEARLKARDWYTNATWDQLAEKHPQVTAVVAKWAQGLLPNPVPRVTNFAAPRVASNYLKNNPASKLYYKGENWYIIDPAAASWPDSYVRMNSPTGFIATAVPIRPSTVFAAIMKGVTEWWRIG